MRKISLTASLALIFVLLAATVSHAARSHQELLQEAQYEVERICGSLVQFMDRPEQVNRFEVIDEDVINAFADDSGRVAVFMGMINFFQSEDELAAVCGHELAHLSAKHIDRSVGSNILGAVVAEVVGGTLGNVAGAMVANKSSRKHEREADRLGLLYAWNAGYNPYVSVDLWEGMSRIGGGMPFERYLSTHPVDTERIENFRVLLTRYCRDGSTSTHCDEILADTELQQIFRNFESR